MFEHSQRTNVNGYDFNVFLEQSRQIYKPMFDKEYEHEKEFKRHMLAMEAIAEEAFIKDNNSLQKKLNESQESITSPVLISKLMQHDLWNYDFVTVNDPLEYSDRADSFREIFFGVSISLSSSRSTWDSRSPTPSPIWPSKTSSTS